MKRTARTSKPLIAHWNDHLQRGKTDDENLKQYQSISIDVRQLEIELDSLPAHHWRKKSALCDEYLHWLYLLEVVAESVKDPDMPF